MADIGSVFLGDSKRHRALWGTTPPSSPPPTVTIGNSMFSALPSPVLSKQHTTTTTTTPSRPIDSAMALELRIRWLEALVLGVKAESSSNRKGKEREDPLTKSTEHLQRQLQAIVDANDGLKRFMAHYERFAQYLTPSFALSGLLAEPPTYQNMSPEELETFLVEMEPDIRAADRDMREIEVLVEQRGVTGPGRLPEHERLQARLDTVLQMHTEDLTLAEDLERRIAGIMERHASQVDTLSELFVAWDDAVTGIEDNVAKLERDRDERRRLGLE